MMTMMAATAVREDLTRRLRDLKRHVRVMMTTTALVRVPVQVHRQA
jgi:hypothetical protein